MIVASLFEKGPNAWTWSFEPLMTKATPSIGVELGIYAELYIATPEITVTFGILVILFQLKLPDGISVWQLNYDS